MRTIGLPELLILVGVFVLIPLAALAMVYLVRRIEATERLRAIEKGVAIPRTPSDPMARAENLRQSAMILLALGIGLFIMMTTLVGVDDRGVQIGIGVGAVPFLLGVALLLEYGLRTRNRLKPPA